MRRLPRIERVEYGEQHGRAASRVLIVLVGAIAMLTVLTSPSVGQVAADAVPSIEFNPAGQALPALLAILAVICWNATFVAAEIALELLRPHHALQQRETSEAKARILERLYRDHARLAAACTFGNQLARILMVLIGLAPAFGLADFLEKRFGLAPGYPAVLVATAAIWAPIFLLNMVVGELVPKSYASLHPARVALRLRRFVEFFGFLFSTPASLVAQLAGLLTARFGGKASFLGVSTSEEEILNLVASAQAVGEIEMDEKDLLESVFEFGDTVAKEVMTPRTDLDALPIGSTPNAAIALIESSGHSRIPLFEETDDQIVGVVHAKDILRALRKGKVFKLRDLMREPLFVPENKSLSDLLQEMRQRRTQLAVVQDEFGGTSGIVTVEDIIEELVGEIRDEYDEDEVAIQRTAEGGLLVDAMTPVDEVAEELGVDLISDEFDTIGGYVFGLFGRQPQPGESIKEGSLCFTVTQTDGRRIHQLAIATVPYDD